MKLGALEQVATRREKGKIVKKFNTKAVGSFHAH